MAKPMLHHSMSKGTRNASPMPVETMCPTITLAGCDNGLPGAENSITQLAPNGAISQELPVPWLSQASVAIASRPPMPALSTGARD